MQSIQLTSLGLEKEFKTPTIAKKLHKCDIQSFQGLGSRTVDALGGTTIIKTWHERHEGLGSAK